MAKIDVTGWVQDWSKDKPQPHWGMKFSESHQRQTADGYEVASRTFWTVKAGWQVEIDFTQYKSGDRLRIQGSQITEKSVGKDGKEYNNLILRAESIERVQDLRKMPEPNQDDVPF